MKTFKFTIIVLCVLISIIDLNCFQHKKKLFEDDDRVLSYRSIFIYKIASIVEAKRKPFTEVRPDQTSSPLKLSKEQIGRFSWYNYMY